jgi:ubiquitin-conjugating enzyme E2 N
MLAIPPSCSLPQFLDSPTFRSWQASQSRRLGKEFERLQDFMHKQDDRHYIGNLAGPLMYSVRMNDVNDSGKGFSVRICGPHGTPFAGGVFDMVMFLSEEYPMEPPVMRFITPVYHPNVDLHTGEINISILTYQWSPALQMRTVILSVIGLLSAPDARDEHCWAGNEAMHEVAQLCRNEPQKWAEVAREWTVRHASAPTWSCASHARAPRALRKRARFLLMIQYHLSRMHGLGGAFADVWLTYVMPSALRLLWAGSAHVLPSDEQELFELELFGKDQQAHEHADDSSSDDEGK